MKVLVSACLLGNNCRYDGGNSFDEYVSSLAEKCNLIPVCAEQLGGLSTPRHPAEIIGEDVYMNCGRRVTAEFCEGARKVLERAIEEKVDFAILKESSPSCGANRIYDGSFSGKKKDGKGITARLLIDNK
ncbi:MAG: DUF523 domain-containing protein, partial [Clostridia bacterium]